MYYACVILDNLSDSLYIPLTGSGYSNMLFVNLYTLFRRCSPQVDYGNCKAY